MDDPIRTWRDDVDWHPVDRKLVWARLIRLALYGLPATTLAAVLCQWWWGTRFALLAVGTGALLLLLRTAAIVRGVAAWGYAEHDEHLLVRHGVWTRRLSAVPYGRLQYLDVAADPVERMLRLSTVKLHTAAATTDATVPGLSPRAATELRDRLADVSGARTEGL